MAEVQPDKPPSLLDVYMARREDLKRYFTVRLGSPEAAEDLVQDIYFKIAAGDRSTDIASPAAFLYRLGVNLMLDRIKQQRRAAKRERGYVEATATTLGGEAVAQVPSADDAMDSRQRLTQMLAALEELTPAVRRAFRLHKLEGLSHAETAAALGVSKSTVEKHISAALRQLLARLAR